MPKEIELTVYDIDRGEIIKRLKEVGATFVGKYCFKTINFQLEKENSIKSLEQDKNDEMYYTAWARIRTDGTNTTLTLKEQHGTSITKRKEYEVSVDDFTKTVKIIISLNPKIQYNYIESEREEYKLGVITIDINKRLGLPYSIEIEASSEDLVNAAYKQLNITKKPMKSIAVGDYEFYKLFGVDYSEVQKEYTKKLRKMLEDLEKL